jgi:hypothetical protein
MRTWSQRLFSGIRHHSLGFLEHSQSTRLWTWRLRIPRPGPRLNQNSARFGHVTTLRAGAAGGAVVLALAHKPLDTTMPAEKKDKLNDIWQAAFRLDSIAKAREAAWQSTEAWLAHYFRGTFIDEGSLKEDMVIARGLYIPAADTRIFWLPPENRYTTPTVCLSLNFAWRASLEDCSSMTDKDLDEDDAKWYANTIENRILYELQGYLDRWQTERGADRFFIILRFQDVTGYFAYDQEGWETMGDGDILTKEDVIIRQ